MVSCKACKLVKCYEHWGKITSDSFILSIIKGYEIQFKSVPFQTVEPIVPTFSPSDEKLINESIDKLLNTGAIIKSDNEEGQFVSTMFTVPKPDGTRRPILNLRKLNLFVESPHFKMETIKNVSDLVTKDCFMAVVDLKDAYHAVPMGEISQKYLKFRWNGQLYTYTCLPFGFSLAPYLFTKLTKPIVAKLRSQGVIVLAYLDDILIFGNNYDECMTNMEKIISLLQKLGFTVNREKSQLLPSKIVRYLGFMINSGNMLLSLPEEKKVSLSEKCAAVIKSKQITIRKLAELIGSLIAAVPATRYGLLYTRQLEIEKIAALANNNNNYSGKICISNIAKNDLTWWIQVLPNSFRSIQNIVKHDREMFTDASLLGWGAFCEGVETKGTWSANFLSYHINLLELYAVYFGLKALIKDRNIHILLRVDNTTTLAYINRSGGCKPDLHEIAKKIWQYAEQNNITLTASYINTKQNVIADRLSREKASSSDFMLSGNYFQKICKTFGQPTMDLFASHSTTQCEKFYSYRPDPYSQGVDSFLFTWFDGEYAFPPFNMVAKTIQKIKQDKCEIIVVAPFWKTQHWFPLYKMLAISEIIIMGPNRHLLFDPYRQCYRTINKRFSLMAAVLSGKNGQI